MKKLPDAELSVMLVIWNSKEKLTSNEILEQLDDKGWHIATLNKLLTRLTDKGFIDSNKPKRPKKYSWIIHENDYKKFESKSFFTKIHKNSFSSLVASLIEEDTLSEQDIIELEKFLEQKKGSSN